MKFPKFASIVGHLVSKVADRPLEDVDPEFNLAPYFDEGAEIGDQILAAQSCANRILFENGFADEEE